MDTIDDPYLRHLFDGNSLFNVYEEDAINLSVGAPGPDLLQQCVTMLKEATNHRLAKEKEEGKYYLFQYGITAGLWECREELAKFLTRRYGDPVKRENLILTCGASHGLQLLLNTVLSPNGVIFVDEVTYMIALDTFKQFPLMKIVTVPMKNQGGYHQILDIDAFEKIVIDEKQNGDYVTNDQKIFWAMFYTMPVYHNPATTTFTSTKCKHLIDIARKNSIMVACDDVYNLLHYGGHFPPHRLFFYDDPTDPEYKGGNVVSNGTFSKILSPAIRFGWMECSSRIANIFRSSFGFYSGILCSGGAVNHYVSGIVTSLLQLNIEDNYLDKLISIYRERLSAVCKVLDNFLPRCCFYHRPYGGYFVWIQLPSDMSGSHFIKWCQDNHKVSAIPGVRFSYSGKLDHFLRLSIAFHQKETLETAVKTLCTALSTYIRKNVKSK